MAINNSIEVSNAALVEGIVKMSAHAKYLMLGMLLERAIDRDDKRGGSFQSAMRMGGGEIALPNNIDELTKVGVLLRNDEGTAFVLHSMLSQVGQNMRDWSVRDEAIKPSPFNVVAFSALAV